MDPFRTLVDDHRLAERLFDQIDKAQGDERTPLIEQLVTALQGHMAIEEEIVYPLVLELIGTEEDQEANTEHTLARDGITTMQGLAPDEPGFGAALEMLKSGILHHVEEEEKELFPELTKKLGDRTTQVQEQILARRQELGLPTTIDLTSATKEELYAQATELGIEGRSDMTKDQLIKALQKA